MSKSEPSCPQLKAPASLSKPLMRSLKQLEQRAARRQARKKHSTCEAPPVVNQPWALLLNEHSAEEAIKVLGNGPECTSVASIEECARVKRVRLSMRPGPR